MKIICVDDEEQILARTVTQCRELMGDAEVWGFCDAEKTLDWLEDHEADIAILDILMPGMDGLALAERILDLYPDTSVIFLTGHERFALEAFRLHVSGYLVKPVSREELMEELEFARTGRRKPKKGHKRHIVAQTFGEFDLLVDGRAVAFPRAKSKELLAYLIDRKGGSVTRASIFAALWEEGTYDRSRQKYLDVIIRSLRKTLAEYGIGDILEMQRGSLRICPEKIDCDLYRFLDGDLKMINAYRGEYMSAYSWANMTEAMVDNMRWDL